MGKAKILVIFAFFVALFCASFLVEGEFQSSSRHDRSAPVSLGDKHISAYYFFGQRCPHCEKNEPFIGQMKNEHSLTIHNYDVYNQRDKLALLNQYFDRRSVHTSERGVLTLFLSNATYFVGDEMILQNLEQVLSEELKEDSLVGAASDSNLERQEDYANDTC